MIAVDTSALMAILLEEPEADACGAALEANPAVVISAATVAEALIVAGRRGYGEEMRRFIESLHFRVVDVTPDQAQRVADTHARWGRGAKSAGFNFGDCFAYTVAKDHACPLLFVGRDFAKTDLKSVL